MDLTDPIGDHFRLVETQKHALRKLGLETLRDLLYHFPSRYEDISSIKKISELSLGETAMIYGVVEGLSTRKAWRQRIPIAEGYVRDETGKIKIIWFHQPYLAKMLPEGSPVKLAGKVTGKEGALYLANPEVERLEILPSFEDSLFANKTEVGALYPVYPESRGITSRWFHHALAKILPEAHTLPDVIPNDILSRYHLPSLSTALLFIHAPRKAKDAVAARKRFAFEEVFLIQLAKHRARKEYAKQPALSIDIAKETIHTFTSRFPFPFTKAQKRVIEEILADFRRGSAMSRLLEGDVGSGKTAVAATTVYATITTRPRNPFDKAQDRPFDRTQGRQNFGNLQAAYMAPTEILANQHFESFIEYFSHLPISIGLITSSGCKKFPSKVDQSGATSIPRAQLLKWVANGEIPILIGTHALIQKSVRFKHLAYVIIDEQHRFGTLQRQGLVKKRDDFLPHLLSMTATPIPRTLALTIYGDLDLSLLDEMPPGRKQIITDIVPPSARERAYQKIREELSAGRQAYVICPRIDEPDETKELALYAKSVKEEAKRLKRDVFPDAEIAVLHGKVSPAERDRIMADFLKNKINILVATSVIEVGVNVPNATVIIIEGAERFGLAQLHQLRGRVLRSTHQAYCFVFTEVKGGHTLDRLKALKTAKNGFELAELDLSLRGPGELSGRKQWGISDVGMEALKNIKMVEAARAEARALIEHDPELHDSPLLREQVERRGHDIHLE